MADNEQQAINDAFITIIESYLGVKRTTISITDTWASNPPPEAGNKTLQEYLEMVRQTGTFWLFGLSRVERCMADVIRYISYLR